MSVTTQALTKVQFASFELQFLDADDGQHPALRGLRVQVNGLDAGGKPAGVLFKGRSDARGAVHMRIPTNASDEALPKLQVVVLDLDGDALENVELKPERGKALPPIQVSIKKQTVKIAAPLNGKPGDILGRGGSKELGEFLKKKKIESLAMLRSAKLDEMGGLSETDLQDIRDLVAHAQLQLLSRDLKVNQALIKAGFPDVLSIARVRRAEFEKAVKGTAAEETAGALRDLAMQKVEVLKNLAVERRVAKANGFSSATAQQPGSSAAGTPAEDDPQPCTCDCQSAVSPLAYLADLLDFVLREVTDARGPLTLERLEGYFHQPLASLPGDCSASEEIVRQVRICVEVLRRHADAENKNVDHAHVSMHVERAYDALLAALGTSVRELRLLRGAAEPNRERKAGALGISKDKLNDLILQGDALSEANLEQIFGLQDTTRDPLSFGVKPNDPAKHLPRWQLKGVKWRVNTDESGRIYGRINRDTNPNGFTLDLFKDSGRTDDGRLAWGQADRENNAPSDLELEERNSSGLSGRMLIASSAQNLDFELVVVPQLLIWQMLELIALWHREDHPAPLYDPKLPIVDPDMLSEGHFCRPLEITDASGTEVIRNVAHGLRTSRAKELQSLSDSIGSNASGTVWEMIDDAWPDGQAPDWDGIAADLSGSDEDTVAATLSKLQQLYLTPETFAFLNELRKRASDGGAPPASSDPEIAAREREERGMAIDILVSVRKRRDLYPKWQEQESTNNLRLSPTYFCIPSTESVPANPLRVSAEQYALWRSELERNSQRPIVDPDIFDPRVHFGATDGVAESLRRERIKVLNGTFEALTSAFGAKPADRQAAWLDDLLGGADVQDGANTTVVHALGLENLEALQQAFDSQRLDLEPQQHGLTVREVAALLTLRRLVISGAADDRDWNHAFHILIQAEKRRYHYPRWRDEEAKESLTLSPEFFRDPDSSLLQFMAGVGDPRPLEAIEWRSDAAAARAWRSRLAARYKQQAAVRESLRGVVNRAEEATLPALRDALIDAIHNNLTGSERDQHKRAMTNKLLINAFEGGCRKTTRVAQAVETMQLLVWGVLNGQLEDLNFSIPDQHQDDFASNWHWLQSYATWRAAMFVYLYPENLLHPRLRPEEEKTLLFRAIVRVLDGMAAPPGPRHEEIVGSVAQEQVPAEQLDIEATLFSALGGCPLGSVAGIQMVLPQLKTWRLEITHEALVVSDVIPGNWRTVYGPRYFLGWTYLKEGGLRQNGRALRLCIYTSDQAYKEDNYYIPSLFGLFLQDVGSFEAASALLTQLWSPVFDTGTDGNSVGLYPPSDDWLTDVLNPHSLAATRSGVSERFKIISTTRCLLDYAEAEFTTDTPESLGRARELYLSAQRLLDQFKLSIPECQASKLLVKVGERYRDRPDVAGIVGDVVIELGAEIDQSRLADLMNELGKIADKYSLELHPAPGMRNDVIDLVRKYIGHREPVMLRDRIDGMARSQDRMLGSLLSEPDVFGMVQLARRAEISKAARAPGQYAMASNSGIFVPVLPPDPGITVGGEWVSEALFEFCIPPNPVLIGLRLRTETGLFKLNHCMNVAGLRREVPAYAAPTDTRSGMPTIGVSGTLSLPVTNRLQGTQYRYKVLVERAKQLVGIAQQLEATYLSFLEKLDQEDYTILRARHDLGLANASVTLQGLRVTEAGNGKDLAEEQWNRADATQEHYDDLLSQPNWLELGALISLYTSAAVQGIAALAAVAAGIAGGASFTGVLAAIPTAGTGGPGGAVLGGAAGGASGLVASGILGGGAALGTLSSALSMHASFDRRTQEWSFQKALADKDLEIAVIQQTLAADRHNIVLQEEAIAEIGAANAEDVVNFLSNKFTSADLYNWMSGVIGGVYRYFLEQSTAMAKMAQMQLAFERQEQGLDFILSDYWTVTSARGSLGGTQSEQPDRRGMSGSARLLYDLYRLDQHAFTTDRRKLQLSKILSLAMHDPVAFQQFRATGVLPFMTTLELFDRDFPGHYLRLIKRVRTTVLALIPPTQGIKATFSSTGISRVVVSTESGGLFEERAIPREPESIALTAPSNDSGVFELTEQADMLLPFEGLGVANSWELRLPKAANAFDFGTIADVLVTMEYTALDSSIYRQQVIQQLDGSLSADRPFSFRHQFADAWYDLHNPDQIQDAAQQMVVSFATRREDFPPNISDLRIEQISLLVAYRDGTEERIKELGLSFKATGQSGFAGGSASPNDAGIASTRLGNAGSWNAMRTSPPFGDWTLSLRTGDTVPDDVFKLFQEDRIEDILFVITVGGTLPAWPT